MFGQTRGGKTSRRPGRVALFDPFRVLPAERGKRDDASVQPDVADLSYAPHLGPTGGATDGDPVYPRAPQLNQVAKRRRGQLRELLAGTDHSEMAALAGIEGEREAVVATPRDVPVGHVDEPVVHPLAHVLRRPLDAAVGGANRLRG